MSELYENLLIRYENRSYWIDDNDLKGVILHNETIDKIREMWVKFKYFKFSLVKKVGVVVENGYSINRDVYKICIIEFVKYALTRGYDWKLFGQPEWEEIAPKKKKKFIKPRKTTLR